MEFRSLYRKLLVCHNVVYDGKYANCMTNETGILTISSVTACQAMRHQPHQSDAIIDLDVLDFNYQEVVDEGLEIFDEHLNAYAACKVESKVKHKIRNEYKKQCQMCLKVFQENEMISDDFISRKLLTRGTDVQSQPCKSTVEIIKVINKIHELLPDRGYNVRSIITTTLQHLDYESLFNGTKFDDHIDPEMEENHDSLFSHKENFIKNIVKNYINMKAHNIFGKISDEERGVYVRHNNKKNTHFSGQ